MRPEQFWSKVDKSGGPDACWLWTGSMTVAGYGRYNRTYAHRLAHELSIGPIPDGLLVCHHCDNKPCVNPAHLYVGTVADNNRDAMERGQWKKPPNAWGPGRRQRPTHCKRGHPLEGDNVYVDRRGSNICRICQRAHYRAWQARHRIVEQAEQLTLVVA